jgi:lipopolysaccharide biosynthesis glycosyltransferase
MSAKGKPVPASIPALDTPLVSVVLCADKNVEVGLHVTLYSLLESSRQRIRINLILSGYHSHDLAKIYNTLERFNGQYELHIIEADDSRFAKYRGLHGNKFTFMKLMVPEFLDDHRVIYLDSDLIVQRDLSDLFNLDLKGYVVAARGSANIEWQLERKFFTSLGLNEKAKYFNAGVMVIDLQRWRVSGITKKCFEFAEKYPRELIVADQTVLNYVFYENQFFELDSSYNHPLYSTEPVIPIPVPPGKIFHFVGSPKPWDFMGEILHANYPLFHDVLSNTAFRSYKSYHGLSFSKAKRTFRLGRSYFYCVARSFGV